MGHAPRSAPNRSFWFLLAALLPAAVYAVPLLAPPLTVAAGDPDAGLIQRVFPGVPPWWIVLRLVALAGCAVLVALATEARADTETSDPPAPRAQPPHRVLVATLIVCAGALVSSFFASVYGPLLQAAHVLLVMSPPVIVAVAEWQGRPARKITAPDAWLVGVVVLVAYWLLQMPVLAFSSPRAASIVDMWLNFRWIQQAAATSSNILVSGVLPGTTDAYLFFAGIPLMAAAGKVPTFEYLQWVQLFYVGAAAIGLALLIRRIAGGPAACIGVATFLFSPFAFFLVFCPTPYGGIALAILVALLLASFAAVVERSAGALVLIGTLAGYIAATTPALFPFAGFALLLAGVAARRQPAKARGPLLLIVLLSCSAFVVPAFPALSAIAASVERYIERHTPWHDLELILFGQVSPQRINDIWERGRPGFLDVPLGALLSPFAIARTPMRLLSDTLLSPVAGVLAACGLAICCRRARRDTVARVSIFLLALAVLPGFVSSYDRVSLARLIAVPIVMALLAGLGFEALRRRWLHTERALRVSVAMTACTIALSAAVTFDKRLLRTSSTEIALELTRGPNTERGAVLLEHPPFDQKRGDWLNVGIMAENIPRQPLATMVYDGPQVFEHREHTATFLWSPGLESTARVGDAVCARWRDAHIFEIHDQASLSRLFAARPADPDWKPDLPTWRWRREPCPTATQVP